MTIERRIDMWTNRLFEEMDRLFGPIGFDSPQSSPKAAAYPPLNLWEDDDHLFIEAELPGLKVEDMHVAVTEGDQLTIAFERIPLAPRGCNWLRQECGWGRFSRTVTLPTQVNGDAVEATYDAGVLTLQMPKKEEVKPRRIAIKSPGPSALAAAK
jgi:HSP20 family protein